MVYPKLLKEQEASWRRKNPSYAERKFIKLMSSKWLEAYGCKREYLVGGYVIDFAFPSIRLAIEIDGEGYHDDVKDDKRNENLLRLGWDTLRFAANDVEENPLAIKALVIRTVVYLFRHRYEYRSQKRRRKA